jgi:O-antigen/teichoic acid export membrane protein
LLVQLFHVPEESSGGARLVFSLLAAGVVVELPTAVLLSVIEGAQRYGWLRAIEVAGRVGWAAFAVAAVLAGGGLIWLAVASLVMTLVQAVAATLVAHRVQPGLLIRPSLVDRATLRRMFGYGWLLAILRVVSVVYAQMDRAIAGVALGVAAVARYEVVYRIQSAAQFALVTASSAVVPAAAYNVARADTERQRELYVKGSRYAVACAVPITLSAILYARPLIDTWVGPAYADLAGPAQLFLVFPLFWCTHSVGIAMLVGHGRIQRMVAIQGASVLLNLALSILLVRSLGITGVVAGTVIANALAFGPYLRILLSTFDCTLEVWVRRIVAPNLAGAAAQTVFGLLTLGVAERLGNFWGVAALCAASCAVSGTVFLFIGMRRPERSKLLRQLRQ